MHSSGRHHALMRMLHTAYDDGNAAQRSRCRSQNDPLSEEEISQSASYAFIRRFAMQARMDPLFEINRWLRVRKEAQCRVDLLV
jgi:hypothetical protein